MIAIKETKHCDSRALEDGEHLTEEAVKHDTELHIEAVEKCGDFVCGKIKEQFKEHDHTKLSELSEFTDALSSGAKGAEFKKHPWCHCRRSSGSSQPDPSHSLSAVGCCSG